MKGHPGLTLIELLIVVLILAILATLVIGAALKSRESAYDKNIQTSLGQIRWQAEIAYDETRDGYTDWVDDPLIQDELAILLDDIDAALGDPGANCGIYSTCPESYETVLRHSQKQDFCISAPKRSADSEYFCIDHEGTVTETTSECPDYGENDDLLRCPTS